MTDDLTRFRPAGWLPGPHLQTIWGRLFRPRRLVAIDREMLETPDGDTLVLDHLARERSNDGVAGGNGADGGAGPAVRPHLLLLHGLEGSSSSVYMQGLLWLARERGWNATVLNFRSCARDLRNVTRIIPNRAARLYHSGETSDPDFVIRTLKARERESPLLALGVSVGGNVLLKWLGENSDQTAVTAAATLSVPYDLTAGAEVLERGAMGRLYTGNFLGTLRPKILSVLERFPEMNERVDAGRVRRARTFFEFDDAGTAPLHGFEGVQDYYDRSSSLNFVERIRTPTFCLSAADDPFQPRSVLDVVRDRLSPAVELVVTDLGGHVGFISGSPWRALYWAERRVMNELAERAGL